MIGAILSKLGGWKPIAALILTAAIFWGGWTANGWRWEAKAAEMQAEHTREIGTARTDEQAKCKQRQQVTKESSNVYWKHIDDLNREHRAALERVRSGAARQSVRVPGTAGGGHEAGRGADTAGAAEVATESLIDLAAEGDGWAAQLMACQEYVRRATAQ